MKFTLSWLRDHLDTTATAQQVVDAMTMAGLEVEHVDDPATKLAAFSVAKIVEAVQHPNADRLRVCQVETRDGRKEIVCGAPNARVGLTTVYAPIGAYVPGLGVTLVEKPVRGVVSNGMLCSGRELEVTQESDGIVELSSGCLCCTIRGELVTTLESFLRGLDNGRIELDNNIVERSIRPLALTRKNSLFAGSDGGADHWAILASLIETAKLNDIDPQAYITSVITRIVDGHPQSQIDQLMPWNHQP